MKRSRPQDARRELRRMWSSVAVYSCADGTFRVEPKWRKKYSAPGMFTRIHAAVLVGDMLKMPTKRIDWKLRAGSPTAAVVPEGKE